MSDAGIFGLGIAWLFLVVLGFCLYFVPTIIAFARGHKNKLGIFLLNFFLGWSFIAWVVALVWSFSAAQEKIIVINNHNDKRSE